MKRHLCTLLTAIGYCFAAAALPAQTAQSRAELNALVDAQLPSNQQVRISAVRSVLKDFAASFLNFETDGTPLYPAAIGSTLQAHSAALDTIAANGSAYYLSRGNHSGTQAASTISDFSAAALNAVTWSTLTGKPTTFAPSSHTHTASEVTDFASAARAQVESMLVAGSNITLTPSGTGATRQITIASTASGGSSYTFSAPLVNTGGTVSLSAATTGAAGSMSAADKTKLDGIASGATANASDAQLRDRSTHTGTQAISTVTDLQTALDGKLSTSGTAADVNPAGSAIASALSGKLGTSAQAADVNPSGTSIAAALAAKLGTTAQAADVNPAGTAIAAALAGKAASSHGHTASDVSDFASAARTQVESMLVAGSNVTLTPSGTGATRQITVAASGTGGGWASGLLFTTSASVENINASNAETTIFSGTVPGGTLGTQGAISVVIFGTYTNNTGANQVVTLKIKYGATTLYNGNAASIGANTAPRAWRIAFNLFADGATNAQRMEGTGLPIGPIGATPPLSGTDGNAQKPIFGSSAEDSTASKTLEVTITLSTATAGSSWTTHKGSAWKL